MIFRAGLDPAVYDEFLKLSTGFVVAQDLPVDPDFVFIVNFECPKCQMSLESRLSGPPTWLRCPACGRACLPPEMTRVSTSTTANSDESHGFLGDHANGGTVGVLPTRPRRMAPLPSPAPSRTPVSRLLLGTGFFLSTILFLFSLLDSNGARAGLFAFVALVCLVLLIRRPSRPPQEGT